jgi:hypothetical protein
MGSDLQKKRPQKELRIVSLYEELRMKGKQLKIKN